MLLEAAVAAALAQGADLNCSSALSATTRFTRLSQEAVGSPPKVVERYQVPPGVTAYGRPLTGMTLEGERVRDQMLTHLRLHYADSFEVVSASAAQAVGAPCTPIQTAPRCELPNTRHVLADYKVHVVRRSTGGEVMCTQVPPEDDDW